MNFRIELYKIFNTVATFQSISKAANELFMTQSAVSQAIKQLETSIDMVLFNRTAKGVELTEAGVTLYKYTSSAMELLDTGLHKLESLKDLEEGELKIAASDTISTYYLSPRLEKFHKMYPNIKIQIINRVTSESIDLLKRGKVDIAFGNLPFRDDSLHFKKCMTVHDTFVAGSDFFDKKNKIFSRADISKFQLIMLEKKSNSRKYVENAFLESGQKLNVCIELGAHDVLLHLAKINLGISCVIKEFSENYLKDGSLFELKQKNPIPERAIGFCYLKNLLLTPAMKAFMTFLDSDC